MFDRTLKLLSKTDFEQIQNTSILLVGIGGVGGYVLEALIRSGFLKITVIDKDIFDKTNLNRQILATKETIGKEKVLVAKNRAKIINEDAIITAIPKNLTKDDITENLVKSFDYIIDACDSVEVKIKLIEISTLYQKKIISCMGTANRLHPELLEIIPLKNTKIDPLAKKIRTSLKKDSKSLKTIVVCSKEYPKKQKELGTICSVPMAAGALLSSYVIQNIIKSNEK